MVIVSAPVWVAVFVVLVISLPPETHLSEDGDDVQQKNGKRAKKSAHGHIAEALRGLAVDVTTLTPDPRNARQHGERNQRAVEYSLQTFGQRSPLVVQKTGDQLVVRAGNARLAAAQALGWTHVAVVVVEEDDDAAMAYALADNRTAELATWDHEILASVFATLDSALADATGFDITDRGVLDDGWGVQPLDADTIESLPNDGDTRVVKVDGVSAAEAGQVVTAITDTLAELGLAHSSVKVY